MKNAFIAYLNGCFKKNLYVMFIYSPANWKKKRNTFSIASVFIPYGPSVATALIVVSKLQLVTLRDNQEKGQGRLCPGLNNLWLLY